MQAIESAILPKTAFVAHASGLGAFAALKGLAAMFPLCIETWFSMPAARLTSSFLGRSLETTADGSIGFVFRGIDVLVTHACSGFSFFTLSSALFVGFATTRFTKKQWFFDLPVGLGLIYLLTVFANSVRMICAVQIRLVTTRFVPDSYDAAIHMSVGMIVFIPILLIGWKFLHYLYEPE